MSSRLAKTATILTISAALLLVACSSGIVKSLTDIARLRQQLIDNSRTVTISLNNRRFKLSQENIAALQSMVAYLPQPHN